MKKLTALSLNHYSIFTAKGLNSSKLKAALFLMFFIGILSSHAAAVLYIEDFEYEKPDQNDFINGLFHHSIKPKPPMNLPIWDISDEWSPPDGTALNLWPAVDEITFDLGPNQYIDYAGIDFIGWGTYATFEVIGTLDTYSVSVMSTDWVSADTSGQNLGYITKVKLSSNEGGFDNLTINVVPEPATILLFGLGAVILRKRCWLLRSRRSLMRP